MSAQVLVQVEEPAGRRFTDRAALDTNASYGWTLLEEALAAHRQLGCRGASRSDFRWDDEQGVEGLYLLEVNTQPGMTPLSLVPEQARHTGMSYPQLVQAIVDEAMVGARGS